jgi:hypothetical protein
MILCGTDFGDIQRWPETTSKMPPIMDIQLSKNVKSKWRWPLRGVQIGHKYHRLQMQPEVSEAKKA